MRRRDFLKTMAGSAIWLGMPVWATRGNSTEPGLGPLADLVEAFLQRAGAAEPVEPTGLSREHYLDVVLGNVRFFRNFQDERGAIIDPYTEGERQYSTPSYAHCCAVLCAARPELRAELLESGAKAMDWAVRTLADGEPADRHGDFFTVKLMHALRHFRGVVEPARIRVWENDLKRLDPTKSYRDILELKGTPNRVHNWNFVAISGEYLRAREGLGGMEFVRRYLPIQVERFTEHGMYVDPGNPMAYDVFTRYHLAILLANGYDGPHGEDLRTAHWRGAWSALFLQSPAGEVPCGGRSAHHQWNEAAQTATFEIVAAELWRQGRRLEAAAFKRAARLGLESIRRWVRATGELWIVKNYFDPSARWGFENYSFHSQYNLLAASMLANAYTYANDAVPEGVAPTDLGGYVYTLDDGMTDAFKATGFHKTVLNQGGLYVLIEHAGDHEYNPTGILRLHARGLRGISDGSVNTAHYFKRDWSREKDGPGTIAVSPIWRQGDAEDGLALYTAEEIANRWTVRSAKAGRDRVEVVALYDLPHGGRVERLFAVQNGRLRVRESVAGAKAVGALWPVWSFDGRNMAEVELGTRSLRFRIGDVVQTYRVLAPESVAISLRPGEWPFRNGFVKAVEVWSEDRSIEYEVVLEKA